jgi:hypothetical protein
MLDKHAGRLTTWPVSSTSAYGVPMVDALDLQVEQASKVGQLAFCTATFCQPLGSYQRQHKHASVLLLHFANHG